MRTLSGLQAACGKQLPRNPLLRLLVVNGVIGVFVSGVFLTGVFAANIGNLRGLVANSDSPMIPIVMLAFGFIITMTSVVMGSAIMMLQLQDPPRCGKPGRTDHCADAGLSPLAAIASSGRRRYVGISR